MAIYNALQEQIAQKIEKETDIKKWKDWKWQLRNSVKSIEKFEQLTGIHFEDCDREILKETVSKFPLGTLVKAGVHGPTYWEDTPLYFKELAFVGSNAFGFEEVDGARKHGIEHYLDFVDQGRVDLTGMLTHRFGLDDWRDAFTALATQDESGAIKVAFDFRT
jgi:hypothetical protein